MEQHLAVTFSPGQLAVLVVIFGVLLWWGFARLIGSIDNQFAEMREEMREMREEMREMRKEHPTRTELRLGLEGAHRRIDDLHAVVHGERPDRRGG